MIYKGITIFRKRAKMSQAELAEKLGVTRATIVNWENGHRNPTKAKQQILCELFGCTVEELKTGESTQSDEEILIDYEELPQLIERLYLYVDLLDPTKKGKEHLVNGVSVPLSSLVQGFQMRQPISDNLVLELSVSSR